MNVGIIGTGVISCIAIEKITMIEDAKVTALWCHTAANGKRVADKYQITSLYEDIDCFLSDDSYTIVYIAIPNQLHYEFMKKCLLKGKHVICEKPFTSNAKQAEELIQIAKQNHLFLFDGTANHFYDNYWELKRRVPEVGNIKMMHINLSQMSSKYEAYQKGEIYPVFDPSTYGGALYDLNSINLLFVIGLFGKPDSYQYYPNIGKNGVDTSGILILTYPEFQVDCIAAKDSNCPNYMILQGDKGWFQLFGNPGVVEGIELVKNGEQAELIDIECNVDQRENLFRKIIMMIEQQDYERCYKELQNTQIVMNILDSIRNEMYKEG